MPRGVVFAILKQAAALRR
jgi:hypothetical protein